MFKFWHPPSLLPHQRFSLQISISFRGTLSGLLFTLILSDFFFSVGVRCR